MTTDPRPAPDEHDRPRRSWLSVGDVALGLGLGLVLAAVLVALMPDVRTHLTGGTDRRETTVVTVREGSRPEEVDRPLTTYDVQWSDGADIRTATFRRSGRPDREVGDSWTLWVSPDGSAVETSSSLTTWLWLGLGLPAFTLLIGVIVRWRGRAIERSAIKEADRLEARRRRRAVRS